MRVTKVETWRSREPLPLVEPWLPAWEQPSGEPRVSLPYGFYRVYTDEGIVGIGPHTGCPDPSILIGQDPYHVEAFWDRHMSGKRAGSSGTQAAGLEIALWDILGKAAGMPVYRLLGAYRDKLPVYAATSRLLSAEQHVRQVTALVDEGFRAVKLRMHRPDPRDDLAVVEAVRRAVGDDLQILVDANQNNKSEGYSYWSMETSLAVAAELESLGVYFLEEPRPRMDVEGLAQVAASVDMLIAGGEHTPTAYGFREHLVKDAYDVVQPDVVLGGNEGITGIRKVATVADCFGKLVVPHVMSGGTMALCLATTLQAMATVENCPMVEYPYDPPILTVDTTQNLLTEPLLIDDEGCVGVPTRPGLGVEIDEDRLSGNLVVKSH